MASNSEMLGQSNLDLNTLTGSYIIVLISACCDDQCLLELSCSGVAGVLTKLKGHHDCLCRQSPAGCACTVDQVFADGLLLVSHVSICSTHRLRFFIVCTLQD